MKLPKQLTTVTTFSKLLALFVFAVFSLSSFFAGMSYQQILDQTQTSISPITPTPISSNQTANWKTYTSTKYGYIIMHPEDITYREDIEGTADFYLSSATPDKYNQIVVPRLSILFRDDSSPEIAAKEELFNQPYEIVKINNVQGVQITDLHTIFDYYLKNINNKGPVLRFLYDDFPNKATPEEQKKLINIFQKMLSTFKFLDAIPSPTTNQVVCTQDAKLCPDGSYVGRTGPNCEFSPCPK